MIHNLKPHPRYNDSELPWLESIPDSWSVLRSKNIFRVVDVRSTTGLEELLTVSSSDGVVPRSQKKVTMFKAESYVGHKLCWPGDLAINSLWAWMQGLGFSKHHGLVSSAYSVYRPQSEFSIYVNYFHYLLRSAAYKWELQTRSKGVWLSRLQLSDPAFLDMPILVPPKEEQSTIVRYLDYIDRRIKRYIHTKQKLIKLLEEQKQATIHRTVTRGLDSDVKLKPSGVEWLGDVPEHWKVVRLKQVISSIEQGWSPQCDAQKAMNDEWGVLKVGCVNYDSFDASQNKKLPSSLKPISSLEIQDGDILVSRANTRELLGLAALAENPRKKLILCDKLFRFRALPEKSDSRYLVFAIRSKTSRAQIESSTNGASDSMQNIGQGVIKNLLVLLPSLEEQKRIVSTIVNQIDAFVLTIERTHHEITLLREYRTRLIADVVTGRLDVRDAAANLPVETEDTEIFEDELDVDEEYSDDEFEEIPEVDST
jgi:type I restriction enzyme S subunit